MKLATLRNGRIDGQLVVVSRGLTRMAPATGIAPTLQAAIDDWIEMRPALEDLAAGVQGDCRKIGGVKVSWIFSRLFSDQGWMRGLDVEIGENRGRGRGTMRGRHGDQPAR